MERFTCGRSDHGWPLRLFLQVFFVYLTKSMKRRRSKPLKQDPAFQSSLVVEFLLKRDFRDDAVLDNVVAYKLV